MVLLLVGFGVRAIHHGVYRGPTARRTPTPPDRRAGADSVGGRSRRPLIVGAVHGLAGSGALTALVVTTLPSTLTRLSYLALFGAGTTVGHGGALGTGRLAARPLAAHPWVARSLSIAVGGVSTVLGLVWGYPLIAGWF